MPPTWTAKTPTSGSMIWDWSWPSGWPFWRSRPIFRGNLAVKLQECMHSVELSLTQDSSDMKNLWWNVSIHFIPLLLGFWTTHSWWGSSCVILIEWKWSDSTLDGTCCPCEHHQSTVFADAWIFWPQWIETMELQWSPPFNRPSSRCSNPETSRSHLFSLKLCVFLVETRSPQIKGEIPQIYHTFASSLNFPQNNKVVFVVFPGKLPNLTMRGAFPLRTQPWAVSVTS